ncbi:MAG: XRE family transcriptional regulator [Lachnobacterium sp.]|nr:XRE family transcriptional regulator [Lachnobacterium sp.]
MPYSNLKAEMARKNITGETISQFLKIHRNSFYNKVNGDSSFSVNEAIKIQNEFFPDMDLDYLFSTEQSEEQGGE